MCFKELCLVLTLPTKITEIYQIEDTGLFSFFYLKAIQHIQTAYLCHSNKKVTRHSRLTLNSLALLSAIHSITDFLSWADCNGGSEHTGCKDANFVIKTDDLMTICKLIPTPIPSAEVRWWQSGPWLITLVNIFHFTSLSQMTTGCHWLKAIFLKGEPLLSIRWKWFLCLLWCHCLQELYWLGLNILHPQ